MMTTTGNLTEAEIARRHLVAKMASVARWLMDDPGYTRKMAARDLADDARAANEGVWSEAELAQLLGPAAKLPRTVNLLPQNIHVR